MSHGHLYQIDRLDRVATLKLFADSLMTKIDQKINEINEYSRPRNAYEAPTLIEFGPVGALTQSGTAAMSEFGWMWNGMLYCFGGPTRDMC